MFVLFICIQNCFRKILRIIVKYIDLFYNSGSTENSEDDMSVLEAAAQQVGATLVSGFVSDFSFCAEL